MANNCTQDIIVHDEYLKDIASKIELECNELNEIYNDLSNIIFRLYLMAVKSGKMHDAFMEYRDLLNEMKNTINQQGMSIKVNVDNYIYQIDDKDKYLYD